MARVKDFFAGKIEANARYREERGLDEPRIPAEWLEMTLDAWTGDYRDHFNDVFVTRALGRKLWTVASREAGNTTVVHSRHSDVEIALAAARSVIVARRMSA